MGIQEAEKVVLDNGYVGFRKKLTLTNKRLIYRKKEGLFKSEWIVEKEIPLELIAEVFTNTNKGLAQSSNAMLKMKDGQIKELNVSLGNEDSIETLFAVDTASDMALRTKTECDRWVNAIDQELRHRVESQTEMLEKRIRALEEKLKERC